MPPLASASRERPLRHARPPLTAAAKHVISTSPFDKVNNETLVKKTS